MTQTTAIYNAKNERVKRDYLKDDKGLRPAMSEAELERELEGRSYPAPGDIRLLTVNDAREIAKKYRGYDE
jgi:hypothetical protein